ncbi:MAG: DUF3014 domain-containing protein [Gammaproteobacteria bacterium]
MEQRDRHQWKEPNLWAPVLIITAILFVVLYFLWGEEKPVEPFQKVMPAPPQEELQLPAETGEPAIQYPVPVPVPEEPEAAVPPSPTEQQPLPVQDLSDAFIEEEFRHLYDEQKFGGLFLLKDIIRNMIVTIDNLTGNKLPQKYSFTTPPGGQFVTFRDVAGNEFIDAKNYNRYQAFIDLAEAADIRRFVSFYVRYYPLFQQAYRGLGYPDRYFNDRFVQVLDHVLAAPEIRVPIKLVRPKVFYQFADPELEALSAGQKLMIRIGPDNALRAKARIKELRQALTTLKKKK